MMSARSAIYLVSCILTANCLSIYADDTTPLKQTFEKQQLFAAGHDGYHTYRIPALAVTTRGTVLAFCEARKNNSADHGDVDLVLRTSHDGGRTWTPMIVVADDGGHTIGNPCPVVDRETGTIWLTYCRDNQEILVSHSKDDGQNWSPPVAITPQAKKKEWHWVGTGPGHGIQLTSGRLLIPAWADATANLGESQLSYVFFSDDHGATWSLGGSLDQNASDECEVLERTDGSLYMNMRSRQNRILRAFATSNDGGLTWSRVEYDPQLPELSCQGSTIRFSDPRLHDRSRVLFAAPASTSDRSMLTIRMSYDDGRTWPVARAIEQGSAAYSDLAVTLERTILLCYESHNYQQLTLARFEVGWLSAGKDSPDEPIRLFGESRTEPRKLQIYRLLYDLHSPTLELDVSVGDDPDGDGPIEALLTLPSVHAQRHRFLAAINTNAWTMVPPTPAGGRPNYVVDAPSNVEGWVQSSSVLRSPAQQGNWSFWIDRHGKAQLENIAQAVDAKIAVAGFGGLLRSGEIIPAPSEVRHPRSAIGIDASRRWLTLLAVDGRQPGYSEGVSERELAEIMLQFGCQDALNLDGGGSTILMLGDRAGEPQAVNRPSDPTGPRPVPVMLGVRQRELHRASVPLIGYSELRTNLPGGRHANVRTMRAAVIRADGTARQTLGESLADVPDSWTQFAGWSPDGETAVIGRGWQDPKNAEWEEEHKTFRMDPGSWSYDAYLYHLTTSTAVNVSAVDRVSHYNAVNYTPDGKKLVMTSLVGGTSKPFLMDLDGHNKVDVSGGTGGFTYGFSASPDGKLISYHEGYQVYIANADGTNKFHVKTGNPFDFAPRWSSDGEWLLFVSGTHGHSNPHVVRRDGTGLRKLADLNGYQGWVQFLDVPDFHDGSSDIPVWSSDGQSVFYTAKVADRVELFRITLDGQTDQLTESPAGTLHYHLQPSADGKWLLYGSKRRGVRQLFVRRLADGKETQLTQLSMGNAAMWPHWQTGRSWVD